MNRLCPSEEALSEYISGFLREEDKMEIEKHLTRCTECRRLLAEVHEIISKPDVHEIKNKIFYWVPKNKWLIASVVIFLSSFLFSKYFLQFLVASLLLGMKWAVDARVTKILITIHEAWKHDSKEVSNKTFSRFSSKK